MTELETLQKEVDELNLKVLKDYKRFLEIDLLLQEKYYYEISKGRTPNYDFIRNKRQNSFRNYPSQGYESFDSFNKHIDMYYKGKIFENFEQEQFMYDDLALQYQRREIF